MADDNQKPNDQGDPRVYFAAERTLLAWVRTGLAMMGFGFVVARFGFFLREMAAQRIELPPQRFGLSLWIGVTLITLGVVATITSAINYWRIIERLKRGETLRFNPVSLAMVAALLLSLPIRLDLYSPYSPCPTPSDGKWLLCANMPGNNVATFAIDAQSGGLKSVGEPVSIPSPSCIRLLR